MPNKQHWSLNSYQHILRQYNVKIFLIVAQKVLQMRSFNAYNA